MKNYWLFVFLLMLTTACNFAPKEVPNAQELLRRELHTIDWSKVDQYPSYDSCDSITDAEENKTCFFQKLHTEVYELLKNDSIVKISTIDSVQFLVTVSAKSNLDFKTEEVNEKLIPKKMLDSIMNAHQKDFSKVQPATKRGVPVATQFQLQVKIK